MIKYVEIYELQKEGVQKKVGTCSLRPDSSEVKCEGEDWLIADLSNGIEDYLGGKGEKIFPKHGLRFLENLKIHYKSGYLNATDVKS